jgi:hypothetical protein
MEIKKWSFNNPYHLLFGKPAICWEQVWCALEAELLGWGSFPLSYLASIHFQEPSCSGVVQTQWGSLRASQWEGRQSWKRDGPHCPQPVLNISKGTQDNQVITLLTCLDFLWPHDFQWQFLSHPRHKNTSLFKSFRERKLIVPWLLIPRYSVLRYFGKQISVLESKLIVKWAILPEGIWYIMDIYYIH